jgi:hypothetical protein
MVCFISVSMCFKVVFLQKYVLHVHSTYIQEYTSSILYTWIALFCSCFLLFSCVFNAKTFPFEHFTWKPDYTCSIHNTWNALFASCLMFFVFVFTAETCTFDTFHISTRIHMFHSLLMKNNVFSVFSCFFTVF